MMKQHSMILVAATALFFGLSSAASAMECVPTTRITPHPYPGDKKIAPSNHLGKPAGKAQQAAGQQLIISGRLLDKNCNPVRDARIEIWHANPEGKYAYAGFDDVVSNAPTFTGGGSAYSMNDGYFNFITIFPGATRRRAPYINIRVSSPDMKGVFQTQMFFGNDVRNEEDYTYRRLSPSRKATLTMPMRQAGTGGYQAEMAIVLPEKVGRLSY